MQWISVRGSSIGSISQSWLLQFFCKYVTGHQLSRKAPQSRTVYPYTLVFPSITVNVNFGKFRFHLFFSLIFFSEIVQLGEKGTAYIREYMIQERQGKKVCAEKKINSEGKVVRVLERSKKKVSRQLLHTHYY